MAAPATTAPFWSTTVPLSVAVAVWALVAATKVKSKKAKGKTDDLFNIIFSSFLLTAKYGIFGLCPSMCGKAVLFRQRLLVDLAAMPPPRHSLKSVGVYSEKRSF